MPIPIPIKNEPAPAHRKCWIEGRLIKIVAPMSKAIPPIIDVLRYPIFNSNRPAIVDAIGQPIDIVVKVKPAIKADSPITPCTNVGKKLDALIIIIPVNNEVTLAIVIKRYFHIEPGIIGSFDFLS